MNTSLTEGEKLGGAGGGGDEVGVEDKCRNIKGMVADRKKKFG